MCSPVTILVANDQRMIAESLSRLVESWFTALPPITRFAELPMRLRELQPSILLLDLVWREEKINALTELPHLVRLAPDTGFVVLTGHSERGFLDTAMAAGARGYLLKDSAPTEMRVAVEEVLAGRTYITPAVAGSEGFDIRIAIEPLSDVQWSILRRKQDGRTHEATAQELRRDPSVIGYHAREIRRKLGYPPQVHVNWRRVLVRPTPGGLGDGAVVKGQRE